MRRAGEGVVDAERGHGGGDGTSNQANSIYERWARANCNCWVTGVDRP